MLEPPGTLCRVHVRGGDTCSSSVLGGGGPRAEFPAFPQARSCPAASESRHTPCLPAGLSHQPHTNQPSPFQALLPRASMCVPSAWSLFCTIRSQQNATQKGPPGDRLWQHPLAHAFVLVSDSSSEAGSGFTCCSISVPTRTCALDVSRRHFCFMCPLWGRSAPYTSMGLSEQVRGGTGLSALPGDAMGSVGRLRWLWLYSCIEGTESAALGFRKLLRAPCSPSRVPVRRARSAQRSRPHHPRATLCTFLCLSEPGVCVRVYVCVGGWSTHLGKYGASARVITLLWPYFLLKCSGFSLDVCTDC